jgi:serralysin
MVRFVTLPDMPVNPYLKALLTDPEALYPVGWDTSSAIEIFIDDSGARAWSGAERQAMLEAFQTWSRVTNIDFVQVGTKGEADIISVLNESETILGQATLPGGTEPSLIELSVTGTNFDNIQLGGDTFETMVHEIGHAIGLYHPHDGFVFPGVTPDNDQDKGDNGLNQQIWTSMSYVTGWDGQQHAGLSFGTAASPMAFDIAAIQVLYGVRAYATGDTNYALPQTNGLGTGWVSIWDTGGSDTITAASSQSAVTIDLRDAPLVGPNAGGYVSWINGIQGGFTIANGVKVENAIGGGANDTLIGNGHDNRLFGGDGNDTLFGSDGIDRAVFSGNRADFSVFRNGDGSIGVTGPASGTDTINTIEILEFADRSYNMLAAAKAATIDAAGLNALVDLYVAYFNRVPEASGLSYWIDQYAGGKALSTIAVEFYQAGIQFSEVTGYTADMPLEDFVRVLYTNVLARTGANTPTTDEVGYWLDQVSTGAVTREGMVARFLNDARLFYDDANVGYVPRLLDQKVEFGKLHAITYGLDYNDNQTAITTTVSLAAAVTPTDHDGAIAMVGLSADDYFA